MAGLPFTAFNFAVEITRSDAGSPLVGGANDRQVRLAGPATVGQLSLKRGMTEDSFDLWQWMNDSIADPGLRAEAEVVLLAPDGAERARFLLSRCLPMKVKAPPLNGKDGAVAIEELQIAYERITVKKGS